MTEPDLGATLQLHLHDQYDIQGELGRGGMAIVYSARDRKHDRMVAIKILQPEVSASIGCERFLHEIQIEAKLQHPHIVPLYDSGELDGIPFYVMPQVEGETLEERLTREKQLPIEDAIGIAVDVGDALAYAHSMGVVHRDVKPENIMMSGRHAVITDFGIARALAVAGGERLTGTGMAIGTPAYMSPEQAGGENQVDGRSDVYSLGCVLHHMLTGDPPFSGSTAQAVMARHVHEPPPSVKVVRPAVPDEIEKAIYTSLEKVPADRFQTVSDFIRAVESGTGRQSAVGVRTRSVVKRSIVGPVLGAAVVVAAVVLWNLLPSGSVLNPNRVVIFPPDHDVSDQSSATASASVVHALVTALYGTEPMNPLEGWDWLSPAQRANSNLVSPELKKSISREQGARYYIDGFVINEPDSVRVRLRLHDVVGDSLVSRVSGAGLSGASVGPLGVRMVSDLVVDLLNPAGRVDLAGLADRRPAALANWLQGEAAYRTSNFQGAFDYFTRALGQDSMLARAALGAAQAATWLDKTTPSGVDTNMLAESEELVEIAIDNEQFLSERHAHFAYGLRFYLKGNADSAVARLTRALELKPDWAEGRMMLGEVYHHLLPTMWTDSSAESAYASAKRVDSGFTPPLPHLAEYAMRRGELDYAEALVERFGRAAPNNPYGIQHSLMLQCLRTGSTSVPWSEVVERDVFDVLATANLLARSVLEPQCATDAYRAVLNAGRASQDMKSGALVGLQSLMLARGSHDELRDLLGDENVLPIWRQILYLNNTVAGVPFEEEVAAVVRDWGEDYSAISSPQLWALGSWFASQRGSGEVRRIARVLDERTASLESPSDSLASDIMNAYLVLAEGDSSSAVNRFRELRPTSSEINLAWWPWESLGAERLTLARLLLAMGEYEEAHAVASLLDQIQPLVYLAYLPASLEIRIEAAEAMERPSLAERHQRRLEYLRAP